MSSQSQAYPQPVSNGASKPAPGDTPKDLADKAGNKIAGNSGVTSIHSTSGASNVPNETSGPAAEPADTTNKPVNSFSNNQKSSSVPPKSGASNGSTEKSAPTAALSKNAGAVVDVCIICAPFFFFFLVDSIPFLFSRANICHLFSLKNTRI